MELFDGLGAAIDIPFNNIIKSRLYLNELNNLNELMKFMCNKFSVFPFNWNQMRHYLSLNRQFANRSKVCF